MKGYLVMTDFKTYKPSIQFTQEMLADYLYVLSFKGTIPSEIYLTTEGETDKISPIYSQESIFIFQPPYSDFIIKFAIQNDYEGSLTVNEYTMKNEVQVMRKDLPNDASI